MKRQYVAVLSVAAILAGALTTHNAAGEQPATPKIPEWAQKEIKKVEEAAPGITDEQKQKVFKAIETRGKTIKKASDQGLSGEALKAETVKAWSTYVNTMKTILSADQFKEFNKKRLAKGKVKEAGASDK